MSKSSASPRPRGSEQDASHRPIGPEASNVSGPIAGESFPDGGIAAASPELASMLAHELRTPLTTIIVGLDLLGAGLWTMSEAQRSELLGSVRYETERLIRLVDDLVAITRATNVMRVQEPVMVQRLLPSIATREGASYAPAWVSIVVDPATPPVRGDPDEDVLGVLDNLVAVSLAAGPRSRFVEVAVEPAGQGVRVRVTRDSKTEPATGPPAGWLSLAAARALAAGMGGRIGTGRRPGGDVELVLDLPAEPLDA